MSTLSSMSLSYPASGRANLRQPSPEFLQAWEALSDASATCGVDDFIPDVPPPSADERLLWRFRASDRVVDSPIVADGAVYFGAADDRLYAVNVATGDLLWRIQMDRHAWLTVAEGVVYVSSGSYLNAVDAATGNVLWKYETGPIYYSTPAYCRRRRIRRLI